MQNSNTGAPTHEKEMARLMINLAHEGFKLDITSNGEYTRSYIRNEWIEAYKHMCSKSKASIVVVSPRGCSLRMSFEFNETKESSLCDFSSQSSTLKRLVPQLLSALKIPLNSMEC